MTFVKKFERTYSLSHTRFFRWNIVILQGTQCLEKHIIPICAVTKKKLCQFYGQNYINRFVLLYGWILSIILIIYALFWFRCTFYRTEEPLKFFMVFSEFEMKTNENNESEFRFEVYIKKKHRQPCINFFYAKFWEEYTLWEQHINLQNQCEQKTWINKIINIYINLGQE